MVAELFLGAFMSMLFEKLASSDLKRIARSAGIYSEVSLWNDKLLQIQAVLVDAGQKQLAQTTVQSWLNKVHHAAYDIDDVLDDLTTEAARRQMNEASSSTSSKVLNIFSTQFNDVIKNGYKIISYKKITNNLHELVAEKYHLGLIDNIVGRSTTRTKRLEVTSLVDVSSVVGWEGDKEILLGKLLTNESFSRNFSVVSIVGPGGIGKTTLAQVLYNDRKVKDHFELMSWVCVSDDLDIYNITKTIFKDVGGDDINFQSLNQLQVALSEKLSKKRFLFILDDVWNEDSNNWELLQRPFSVGAPGSRIIVTTQKNKVATVVDSTQAYPLKCLSNEEALCLLARYALGKQNFDSHPTLKFYGEVIVNKCGRFPLALITIGRVLRSKTNDKEWEELLNSEIWNSILKHSNILAALRLSYYDLPPHLKQMFVYCCLFPKDYVFEIDELVLLWMAEGFLHGSNGNISMETFGHQCFRELESRSFFQHSTSDIPRYTMHDLISALAMDVAGDFFYMFGDKMGVDYENIRHFSFDGQRYGLSKTLKALQRAQRLRTFLATSVEFARSQAFFRSYKDLVDVLPRLTFLRVLSLAKYKIREVPQSIGGLKHLRLLNFSDSDITCLPEQVGDLYNLQSLLLSGCKKLSMLPNSLVKLVNMRYLNVSKTDITCLPDRVGNLYNLQSLLLSGCHRLSSLPDSLTMLINLRHLDISDIPSLNKLPVGIAGLTGLETISKVIVAGANGFKVSHLKDLQHLEGRLTIEGLHEVTNSTDAKEANLQQKKGLCDLEMKWNDVFDDSRNKLIEFEVLEGLRPFEKLTNLKISNYMGTKFPSWLGDPAYDCLTQITLYGCRSLPTLGHLPSLQKLFVENMNGLKKVASELLGTANGNAFPSLTVLEFKDMESWEEWSTINGGGKDGTAASFPSLSEISVINCPKLCVLTIEPIHSLRVLHVERCSAVTLRSMIGVSSTITRLRVREVNGLTTQLNGEVLEHLRALKYLRILQCDELIYLWDSDEEACKILVNLQELKVTECKNLVRLGEKKVDLVINMMSLRSVRLDKCHKLEGYNSSNSIASLRMSYCDSVSSLTFPIMGDHELPSTLKSVRIEECKNVEVNWLQSNFLSSLTSLHLDIIPNLRWLPEGCLLHLTELRIEGCENIKSIPEKGYGFLPLLCLKYLGIIGCENMKSFPHEQLQSLASLENMLITDCPSMDYLFPGGLWPPNLTYLKIGNLKKPMSKWGMQKFPNSLIHLSLDGENSGVVSFANAEGSSSNTTTSLSSSSSSSSSRSSSSQSSSSLCSFSLPPSLTWLYIENFKELETVSRGLEHLTSLEHLFIWECRKLRDLPEMLLPSLSSLEVYFASWELRKKCSSDRKRKGKYWHIISQIPNHRIH